MKSAILILLTLLSSKVSFCQNVTVKTEKTNYKLDETITLVFEVNAKVDSTYLVKGTNYKMLSTPRKTESISIVDGQSTFLYTLTFEVKAEKSGKIEIICPTFYADHKELKSENLVLTISKDVLTDKEIEQIEFNEFKDNSYKPNGTIRFVLSGNFGFIEVFSDFKWIYKRRLNKKEIRRLKRIKKICC